MMKKKETEYVYSYYDEISSGYNELHGKEQNQKFAEIEKNISHIAGKRYSRRSKLLDVGCGTCLSFGFFNCKVFGIEPSLKMLQQFSELKEYKSNGRIFNANAEQISVFFRKNFFDFVICVTSAHHFSNPEEVLSQISKTAKKEAVIAFSLLKKSEKTKKIISIIKVEFKDKFKILKEEELDKDILIIFKNK